MNNATYREGTFKEVLPVVIEHHYSHRRCADPTSVFVAEQESHLAVAIFAAPLNRWFGRGAVELVRLVRTPHYSEPLSRFIAWCIRQLKKQRRFLYVLAYADSAEDHHGGIYQACSFAYIGLSKGHSMWQCDLTGKIVSNRSFDQQSAKNKIAWTKMKSAPKYLYVKGLLTSTGDVVARLGRASLPYPKPLVDGVTS